jgi:hypothetical protein
MNRKGGEGINFTTVDVLRLYDHVIDHAEQTKVVLREGVEELKRLSQQVGASTDARASLEAAALKAQVLAEHIGPKLIDGLRMQRQAWGRAPRRRKRSEEPRQRQFLALRYQESSSLRSEVETALSNGRKLT